MDRKLLIIGIICFVIFAASFFVYRIQNKGIELGGNKLVGSLYLTLSPLSNSSKLDIYTFDLSNKSLSPLLSNKRDNITPALTVGGDTVAYASKGGEEAAFQIYSMSLQSKYSSPLTQDANPHKSEPTWSSDNIHVAYSVQSLSTSTNLLFPSNWLVFVTDNEKNAKLAGVGSNPFFSPDGQTLFVLQNDGIHSMSVASLYNTKSKQQAGFSKLLVSSITGAGRALKSMKISVAPDGKRLAWSVPTEGYVRIFGVNSWAPLTLVPEKDIPVTALGAAFSPDSQYLALEQVTTAVDAKFTNPKIVIYSLKDYASVTALDLSAYSTKSLWLSAWR